MGAKALLFLLVCFTALATVQATKQFEYNFTGAEAWDDWYVYYNQSGQKLLAEYGSWEDAWAAFPNLENDVEPNWTATYWNSPESVRISPYGLSVYAAGYRQGCEIHEATADNQFHLAFKVTTPIQTVVCQIGYSNYSAIPPYPNYAGFDDTYVNLTALYVKSDHSLMIKGSHSAAYYLNIDIQHDKWHLLNYNITKDGTDYYLSDLSVQYLETVYTSNITDLNGGKGYLISHQPPAQFYLGAAFFDVTVYSGSGSYLYADWWWEGDEQLYYTGTWPGAGSEDGTGGTQTIYEMITDMLPFLMIAFLLATIVGMANGKRRVPGKGRQVTRMTYIKEPRVPR